MSGHDNQLFMVFFPPLRNIEIQCPQLGTWPVAPHKFKGCRLGGIRKGRRRTIERPLVCHVVHEQDPHRTPVVRRRDGPEPLLPRSVPYLQLDPLAVELDGPDLEVDADGGDERRRERVFAEAQQAAGLAYA